jgi:electron transport complex protein RnfE
MAKRSLLSEFSKGIFAQNATFVLVVGLCPTLAVTTSLKNAAAMGVAVLFVLACSNVLVALLRKWIPEAVRIPCFIVIIGSFVTMVEIIFKSKLPPEINAALGIFIPLIVVNCIILYRAESFAYHHGVLRSILDGLGIGLGFALAILLIAGVRETLGSGTIWGYPWLPTSLPVRYVPASILIQAPGAFMVLGLLMGFFKWLGMRRRARRLAQT